jgi:adenosine deaminase
LSAADFITLARNSFEASFLPAPAKDRWMAAIDEYERTAPRWS